MNGIFVFVFAFIVVGAFVLIPRAIEHDRLMEELEEMDALGAEEYERFTDAAWRKGES